MPANAGAARRGCGAAGNPRRRRRGPRRRPCPWLGVFGVRACGSWLSPKLRAGKATHALGCRRTVGSGSPRSPISPAGWCALHLRNAAVQTPDWLALSDRGERRSGPLARAFPQGGMSVRAKHLPKAERWQAELQSRWLCRHSGATSMSSLRCVLLQGRSIRVRLRTPIQVVAPSSHGSTCQACPSSVPVCTLAGTGCASRPVSGLSEAP